MQTSGPGRMPEAEGSMAYEMIYPEIYYRVQPFVLSVCDQMESFDHTMPTQDVIERISDDICSDVCRMYPDLAEYVNHTGYTSTAGNVQPVIAPIFGRRFRRRGLFRDLIDILLLTEIFRRTRGIY